jgi:tetratricopeptide (TPR) repeat protein
MFIFLLSSMKLLYKTLAAFLFVFFSISCGAQKSALTKKQTDSVYYRASQSGAQGYFSHAWQKYYDSLLKIDPTKDEYWQMKAMPYFKHRQYEVGMQYLNKAVEINPKEWLQYRGFINCIFAKNYTAAIADYSLFKKQYGVQVRMEHSTNFYLGLSYLMLNKYDTAKQFFEEDITKSTEASIHFMNWFYLGIVHYEQENYTAAIDNFDKALTEYPNFSDAQFYKAKCLRYLHKNEAAKEMLLLARENFIKGYTFTEDNVVYEPYPYQIAKWYFLL